MAYNKKRRTSQKPDTKVQDKEVMAQPQSMVMQVGLPDGDSLFTVNGTQVNVGATGPSIETIIAHIPMSTNAMASFIDGANALVSSTIQELIDAFATARGYTTDVTAAKIEDYVEYSMQYLAVIMHAYRSQNVAEFKTETGSTLGVTLGSRPAGFSSLNDVANYIGDNGVAPAALVNDGAVGISNSSWSKDYLANLQHVKLNRGLVSYLTTFFGTFYQGESASSTIISFVPDILFGAITLATLKDNISASMSAMRSADRDLIDILHFLGFTNEYHIGIDFTRDLRAQTLPLIKDFNILAGLYNGFYPNLNLNSDTDTGLYWDYFGEASALSYMDRADLDANTVFNHLLIRYFGTEHFQVETFYSNSSGSTSQFLFPTPITLDASIASLSAAQVTRLFIAQITSRVIGIPKGPVDAFATLVLVAPGDYAFVVSATADVLEGFNSYKLPDSYDYYRFAKFADILMGDVNWRVKLQELSNKIKPVSVTRQS